MSTQELYAKKEELYKQLQDIMDVATKEDRLLNAEENVKFDKINAEYGDVDSELVKRKEQEERFSELAKVEFARKGIEKEERKQFGFHVRSQEEYTNMLLMSFLYPQEVSPEARNWMNATQSAGKDAYYVNLQTRGTGFQYTADGAGGYLVDEKWGNSIEKYIVEKSGVRSTCASISTTSGAKYHHPTIDDTSTSSNLVGEGSAITVQDFADSEVTFDAYKLASIVKVTNEWLNDVQIYDALGTVTDLLGDRQGRKSNNLLTLGTGSAQPNGLSAGSTLGKTAASTTAITRSEIIDLIHSVDIGYRGSNQFFMMNDATAAYIRKLTVGSGDDRPLWTNGSIQQGQPSMLEGVPVVINNDIATIAASAIVMIYGNSMKYLVRTVGSPVLSRSDHVYWVNDAVGLRITERIDGDFLNTSAIKHLKLANS